MATSAAVVRAVSLSLGVTADDATAIAGATADPGPGADTGPTHTGEAPPVFRQLPPSASSVAGDGAVAAPLIAAVPASDAGPVPSDVTCGPDATHTAGTPPSACSPSRKRRRNNRSHSHVGRAARRAALRDDQADHCPYIAHPDAQCDDTDNLAPPPPQLPDTGDEPAALSR